MAKIQSDISSLEYLVHVSIIFIQYLMNSKQRITSANIESIRLCLIESLTYFEKWYHVARSRKKSTSDKAWETTVLSKLTYTNLRFGVCGFLRFADIALSRGFYVNMSMSSTSSIEAVFSQARSHGCDDPMSFSQKLPLLNGKQTMVALKSNKMYDPVSELGQNMISIVKTKGREKDKCFHEWKDNLVPVTINPNSLLAKHIYDRSIKNEDDVLSQDLLSHLLLFSIHPNFFEYLRTHQELDAYAYWSIATPTERFFKELYSMTAVDLKNSILSVKLSVHTYSSLLKIVMVVERRTGSVLFG